MNNKQIENYLSKLQEDLLKKALRIKFDSSRDWAKQFPEDAGVYILIENGKPCYVGETDNLRKRIKGLLSSTAHSVRRNIAQVKYSKHKGYEEADENKKFPPHIEKRIHGHFCKSIKVSCITVKLGRMELEKKILYKLLKDGYVLYNRKNLKGDKIST